MLNQQLRSLEEKMETKFFDYDTKLRAMQNKNARDIAWRTSEHDKIKTIREYGHNVLFH